MKRTLLPLLLLVLGFTVAAQSNERIFYYYKGAKVYFPVSYDRLVVGIKPGRSLTAIKKTFSTLISVSKDSLVETSRSKQFIVKLGRDKVIDISPFLTKLKKNPDVLFARPVFKSRSGKYNSYGEEFIVKLKASTTYAMLQELMQKTGSKLVKRYPFHENIYILAAGSSSNYDGLTVANRFYESGLFEYAEPNTLIHNAFDTDPNDPLYNLQWAHKNTGSAAQYSGTPNADMKVQQAWVVSTGSSVTVGLLDEGVDLTHPDLQANLLQGYNAVTGTSNPGDGAPLSPANAHGTNTAGIIAAVANNGIGVAGVAPNCKIISATIDDASGTFVSSAALAASFDYVRINGADVISNSWSGSAENSTVDDAIHRAVTLGRGGKGCLVLFASGNDNDVVCYPATNPEVIAVGGINMCNERKSPSSCDGEDWWGANYGAGLDVVAPCIKIPSTDIQGDGGYNTSAGTAGDYFDIFNGTSAACPNAAGVAALIFSVNSSLTGAHAREILESSCDKIPGYTFGANAAQPNGSWNNELGYGRVNALSAVQQALSLTCLHPTITTVDLTQPDCSSAVEGTIVINATTEGGAIEYSIDGTFYQSSNTFNDVTPGSYAITARLQGGDPNCIESYNANPIVINQPAVGITFTGPTVTQPSCPVPLEGTIVVNATSVNGAMQFSLNGGAYQSSSTFTGLAPGAYYITARVGSSASCVANYPANPVIISPAFTTFSTVSYTGPVVDIPDDNLTGVDIPLTVTGLAHSITNLEFRLDADPSGTCDETEGNIYASVSHTWVGDLVFKLTSPSGKTVILINRPGDIDNSGTNFCTVTLDDEGGLPSIQNVKSSVGSIQGDFSPANPLSAFDNEDPNGTWILNVSDQAGLDVGVLRRFSLVVTTPSPCPVVPTIITRGTLNPFTTCSGSASDEQTFKVSGVVLSDNLTVTAPAGYEVSLTSGSDFASTITFEPTDGTVNGTTVYVRMAASAQGTPSGNIACVSTGSVTQTVAAYGNVNQVLPASVSIFSDASGNIICEGSNINFTASPENGGISPSYQWFVGATPVGDNSPAYSNSGLANGDVVKVVMTANSTCATGSPATSGIFTVAVNALPAAGISGTTVVCQNTSAPEVTFTGLGGTAPFTFTYNLSDGTNTAVGLTISGGNPTVSVPVPTGAPGVYTYTLTNVQDLSSAACAQIISDQIAEVTVKPVPTGIIGGTTTVCQNSARPNVTFTGSGGTAPYTFTYRLSNGGTAITQTTSGSPGAIIAAPTKTPGTYTYTLLSVQDAGSTNCSQIISGQTAVITIKSSQYAAITAASPVSGGSKGNVASVADAGSGASYAWGITNGTITAGNKTHSITYTAGVSGSVKLTVSVTGGSSCGPVTSNQLVKITSQPCPNPAINVAAAVCTSSTGNIASVGDAGAGARYEWSIHNGTITGGIGTKRITYKAGPGNKDPHFNADDSVRLSVVVSNSNRVCTANSGIYRIFISPLPDAIITVKNSICASSKGNTASVPNGGTGAKYAWSISHGTITGGAGTNKITFTASASGSVTLAVKVTNATGCIASSGNKTVTIAAYPTAAIAAPTSVCGGSNNNTASVAGAGTGAIYAWHITNGVITAGSSTKYITWSAGTAGSVTLSVKVTNSGGCSVLSQNKQVSIKASPNVIITASPLVCGGSTNTVFVPSGASSYAWTITNGTITSGKGTRSITYKAGTSGTVKLTITATNSSGCKATATKLVTAIALPVATIIAASPVCSKSTTNIAFVGKGGSGTTYAWTISNGTITSGGSTNNIKYTAGTSGAVTLNVKVKNSGGCTSSGSKAIPISSKVTPVFTKISTLCQNATAPLLPATSTNGVPGSWNPSKISTSSTGAKTYTFTPAAGRCAASITMSITVQKCSSTIKAASPVDESRGEEVIVLEAKVTPNPSASEFTLTLRGNSNKPVEVRLVDMYGRSVYYAKGSANQFYKFGQRFAGGVYIVEILQGNLVKNIKIVKAN